MKSSQKYLVMGEISGNSEFRHSKCPDARWLMIGFLVAITGRAISADATFIGVVKGQRFEQTSPTLVKLRESDDSPDDKALAFEAFAESDAEDSLTSGTVQIPGGTSIPLQRDWGLRHEYQTDSLLDLNSTRSNGTYTIHLVTKNDGTKNISLSLTGDSYPNVPMFTNYNALQAIIYTNDTVVQWSPLSGGTENDIIFFSVYDSASDETVWEDGGPGTFDGTSVSAIIPANTLEPGRTYQAEVVFAKVVDVNTSDYPDVLAVAGYYKQVDLMIKTLAQPGVALGAQFEYAIPQPWAGNVARDSVVSFRFSQPMNPGSQSVSWTSVSLSGFTYQWTDGNKVLLCSYTGGFPADTAVGWSLDLSGFRDAANFPLSGSAEGSFNTSAEDPQSQPDVLWFSVLKIRSYQQAGTTPVSTGMFGCDASIEMPAFNRVKQGTLTAVASGCSGALVANAWDGEARIGINATYASKSDIDRFFTNGSFSFALNTIADGNKNVSLDLGATDDYPAAPSVNNLAALQTIDPDASATVTWTAPANWTNILVSGHSFVELTIENDMGDDVFWIDGTEFTNGSQCIIPANTLWPGRTYYATINFIKIKDVDTESYSGATGVSGFASITEFTLQTIGTVIMPTLGIEPFNNNMNLSISGGEPQRSYVGEASTDLIRWLPQIELWLGDGQQSNQWYDNDAHYLKKRFYRLRDRLPDESVQYCMTIQGTVWTGFTEKTPVVGAVVSTDLDGQTTVTDETGSFFLETDTPGTGGAMGYTITVTKDGTGKSFGPHLWGDQVRDQPFDMN